MKRVAVFIDAGYLYAQGSACLQGSKAKRENIKLDHSKFINILRVLVTKVQPAASLLRIYWYDGISRGPTQDHKVLADLDDIKLRLGFINSLGEQKGVDSLLVSDLVELARNGAICDAVLLGGDEDLRKCMQIAQSFVVRVHLVGIEPCRGSQSPQLRQESDTKHEILAGQVGDFLKVLSATGSIQVASASAAQSAASSVVPPSPESSSVIQQPGVDLLLAQGIDAAIATIGAAGVTDIQTALLLSPVIPAIYDRRFLAACRTFLGRDLDMEEKKLMRAKLAAKVRAIP